MSENEKKTTDPLLALGPCPFCGGAADLNGDDTCGYFVSCRTRDCCMFNRAIWARDEITTAWNTRIPSSRPANARADGAEAVEAARYRYLRDVWGRSIAIIGTDTTRYGISTPSWRGDWECFDDAIDAVMAPAMDEALPAPGSEAES